MENTSIVQCPYCGEDFVITFDPEYRQQVFIDDCAVCCQPSTIHIELDDDGRPYTIDVQRNDE